MTIGTLWSLATRREIGLGSIRPFARPKQPEIPQHKQVSNIILCLILHRKSPCPLTHFRSRIFACGLLSQSISLRRAFSLSVRVVDHELFQSMLVSSRITAYDDDVICIGETPS